MTVDVPSQSCTKITERPPILWRSRSGGSWGGLWFDQSTHTRLKRAQPTQRTCPDFPRFLYFKPFSKVTLHRYIPYGSRFLDTVQHKFSTIIDQNPPGDLVENLLAIICWKYRFWIFFLSCATSPAIQNLKNPSVHWTC